ncbi:hypothetical protein GIJ78_11830 [Escherichia coli]|nr:hypothetical protein [Escherichia coli]
MPSAGPARTGPAPGYQPCPGPPSLPWPVIIKHSCMTI